MCTPLYVGEEVAREDICHDMLSVTAFVILKKILRKLEKTYLARKQLTGLLCQRGVIPGCRRCHDVAVMTGIVIISCRILYQCHCELGPLHFSWLSFPVNDYHGDLRILSFPRYSDSCEHRLFPIIPKAAYFPLQLCIYGVFVSQLVFESFRQRGPMTKLRF